MVSLDPEKILGEVKPLHGVNLGPISRNWALDLREPFQRLAIPSVRLHDCNLDMLDVVDLHCLFPDPVADPDDPGNYRFAMTDDYLKAIRDTGAEIYFRLGESIEWQPTKTYIRLERWGGPRQLGRVCRNIVRHYNDGWADGHHWDIRRWEFWNEPDGSERCWGGTPEQFFDFYRAVAHAIKEYDRSLKVGLAGFASYMSVTGEGDRPRPYRGVLESCVRQGVPVDFVSWHRYARSWPVVIESAVKVRRHLDEMGLERAESHLDEWAYVPSLEDGTDIFSALKSNRHSKVAQCLELMHGPQSAAFNFGVLAGLQNAPLEKAHYYTGVSGAIFGLFEGSGMPRKNMGGLEAFAELAGQERRRIQADSDAPETIAVLATRKGHELKVGLANTNPITTQILLRIESSDPSKIVVQQARQQGEAGWSPIEAVGGPAAGTFKIPLAGAGVTMLTLHLPGRSSNTFTTGG